ncbi:MAG TPA: amidohydrolase [Alcanivorax sp.]|nr:amidohydrolase [Alcanivorax sp.]
MLLPRASLYCLVVTLLLSACSRTETEAPSPGADLLLTNARIYTMNAQRDWAEAVAIRDGRIIFVGSADAAKQHTGDTTKVVDLQGKMLLPSFQDVHIHPIGGGLAYLSCTLFDEVDLDAVLAKIAHCVKENPDADAIVGTGWGWGMFIGEVTPDKKLLDAIDNSRPLIFGDADGHTLWINSAALALAGVTADTPDPEGGAIGRVVGSTEPSGTLLEGPGMDLLNSKLPATSLEQKEQGLLYAQRYLHGLGITAMQDAMVFLASGEEAGDLDTYRSLQEKGQLKLRVRAAIYWDPAKGLAQIPAIKAASKEFTKGRLQATSVKFWADGILETHTARLLEPYTDKPDTLGLLMVPLADMMAAVPLLDAAGFQIHIHAIGDGTVRYALDAIEKARDTNGVRDSRPFIAHTQLVHPDDIGRFVKLQTTATFSPYWATAEEYTSIINPPQIGEQRMQTMYPIAEVLATGARVAFGSDWSVSTADPLMGIEVAIRRQDPEDSTAPVFMPEQRISLDAAIAGYTIEAAHTNFLDADTGSVEVGKYADLVVLSENLFDIATDKISDASVTATLLEGELVYGEL